MHETQNELARLAVIQERLRISRNLHDLLGYSLSAITLKSELIHRLVLAQPQRAKTEVEDVLALSRQSLADVRRVSRGLREMSLESELSSVVALLEATDVELTTSVRLGELGAQVNTVLAAVLREAITNLLRHSRAGRCSIEAVQNGGRVRLVVTNDGVDPDYRDTSQHSGAGLENLRMRLHSVSGRLTIAHGCDGTFQVIAEAPACTVPGQRDAARDTEPWESGEPSALPHSSPAA
ncbi:sensor histidine kinase [Kitasatospora sp. NPDC091335]|uniref:sensor histidine kinase n=1 Tax=Kitasatospora sp. NPDC091335 TaxID=3364085 RepID=UPI0037F2583E